MHTLLEKLLPYNVLMRSFALKTPSAAIPFLFKEDLKSPGSAFEGSNPSPATSKV
jgi:hypothetical protein